MLFNKKIINLFLLLLAFSLSSAEAFAQLGTSGLNGTVVDQTGAVISGATIVVTNQATGQVRETTAGEDGVFTIQNLPPAVYKIKINASGFSPALIEALPV